MSAPRPEVRWPLYVTVWCFVAAVYAAKSQAIFMLCLAAVQVLAVWCLYATSRKPTTEETR